MQAMMSTTIERSLKWLCLVAAAVLYLGCIDRTIFLEAADAGVVKDLQQETPPDLTESSLYLDFPAQPILDSGPGPAVPANSGELFGPAGSGAATGGPCLFDPEIGAMYPRNWLRPRFRFSAPAPQNLFEIRLHVANQVNDLVVYTAATQWTMPAEIWTKLSMHSADLPIAVSVRGAELRGSTLAGMPALGTRGDVSIAPVNANGTIVYWTSSGGALRGFQIGEEKVHDVLAPAQIGAPVTCVGCHSSTPDGNFVGVEQVVSPDPSLSYVGLRSVDGKAQTPSFLTTAGAALLTRAWQVQPVFSGGHWRAGDHVALVLAKIGKPFAINWIDLEAPSQAEGTGWGVIARTGDSKVAASAAWSHSGKTIAYVSTTDSLNGVMADDGDIYTVPYNDRKGGAATPVAGANNPSLNEYYPAWSPDDALLAYNRVPTGQSSYNNVSAEVFVIAAAGGTPTRLDANDPPACSGLTSPGITNSWPKWAPEALPNGGRQFYWVAFSSTREGGKPQLFVTGVVVKDGVVKTYPAIYLWNQPAGENNHTAAWDVFKIIVG